MDCIPRVPLVTAPGRGARQLTEGTTMNFDAVFSPDGKRIALQSDRTGGMEIWVMNVDGTGARQITR